MFVGKARSLPKSGANDPSTLKALLSVGSGLTHKHYTRLKRLARDEHTSLL